MWHLMYRPHADARAYTHTHTHTQALYKGTTAIEIMKPDVECK